MKILFISLLHFKSLGERNIYTDLLREFAKEGHHVDVVSPSERKLGERTKLITLENGNRILSLRIGNIQKCNPIEKGITTVFLGNTLIRAIKKYFSDTKYDVILYPTPPITFSKAVAYVKKRDDAITYLILKDIFPQNAVDLKMMKTSSLLYRYFRKKEKQLYAGADRIGCMSMANVAYLLKHNPELPERKIEVSPNCIEPAVEGNTDRRERKRKYELPVEATVFMYGGNLGKPQDVDFLISCLKKNDSKSDRYFVICGNGTDYYKLADYIEADKPANVRLCKSLPKDVYDDLLQACDVGMIFLDQRFTIPNFPSRILSYMDLSIPVVAFTDTNTDIGNVITDNEFGWWHESTDADSCTMLLDQICKEQENIALYGVRARKFLINEYSASIVYRRMAGSLDELIYKE